MTPTTVCPGGEIGIHAGMRYQCRKAWRFKSSPGHKKQTSGMLMSMSRFCFLCVYFTKLAPISKANSNPRAERVALRTRSVRFASVVIPVSRASTPPLPLRRSAKQKFLYIIFCCPTPRRRAANI